MKVAIIISLWVLGWIVSVFLCMLIMRLNDWDPEDVYTLDDPDLISLYALFIIFWPLAIIAEAAYFFYKFLLKGFIFLIEIIVATKKLEDDEGEDKE